MPEGDTVWLSCRHLHAALAGRVLTRSDFRVPRYATTDLTGRQVLEVASRGKHQLTRVEGGVTVHTHLRMEGNWRIKPMAQTSGYPLRDHRIRLVLANAGYQAVGFQLGVVEVLKTSREDQAVGHLGPDLLGPDWDQAEAVRRLAAKPDRPIGEALLDQANLAGIGNLYKAEVLFLRGLNPWEPVGTAGDLGSLVELARQLLDANKERFSQVTTGNPARGQETWVYGRSGRPCRRCRTPIKSDGYAGRGSTPMERITFWCPSCQK
jgi:formamidopyrimidine-DNA glycosylase